MLLAQPYPDVPTVVVVRTQWALARRAEGHLGGSGRRSFVTCSEVPAITHSSSVCTQHSSEMPLASLACLVVAVVSQRQGQTKTNVLFVLLDDVGWGDLGYQATPARQNQPGAGGVPWTPNPARTPNIDAMARSSLVLNRFYSGSPVCSPTRSSTLSGRTPDRECIWTAEGCGQQPAYTCADSLPLPPPVYTVAELAKDEGMDTLFLGKWHLGNFFPKPATKASHYMTT